ncbi:hypothetical protein [Rheinheimera aquimaris]|uniref:hypothetical protein n=1 Tax=Rheinheimera aquimaris TaxID=412437 RepID=UPI001E3DFA91|nr:hypothetical protein [Rheinheimera aquimaris]MCD1597027.1 hypothetical protein [Rheinheimera aquimaris]
MAEEKSIDVAIKNLEEQIEQHREASRRILFYVMYVVSLLLVIGAAIFVYQDYRTTEISSKIGGISSGAYFSSGINPATSNDNADKSKLETGGSSNGGSIGVGGGFSSGFYAPNTTVLYVFVVLFVVVFGVMMAVYRFHLNEISRSEQLKVGFMRIRIAANNHDNQGFSTEVRMALTDNAFTFQTGKEKKVESPLPGHPSSDLGALLVNKLLESVDFKVTKKD